MGRPCFLPLGPLEKGPQPSLPGSRNIDVHSIGRHQSESRKVEAAITITILTAEGTPDAEEEAEEGEAPSRARSPGSAALLCGRERTNTNL